ncbi:twin-arginine translocase TatA/TatE family subunit [Maritalea mediterranea]|uniref:Sec-independent protein translocase protein TatA n=1 Tax=Maritalea mediterranea TaxID=2909667 RepID=A0ABS9EA05_9HYPH|nr:twin-arginine translocase TatA/TatE family subunit [Maritalea mediterranea]MCF4098281.1 twin-arginine translocase TatA/TatE family subunit [Maritalea mediterranea]
MNPGPWGILIIAIAALLLFGRGKISGMMGEVASGIKAFRKGMQDDDEKTGEIESNKTVESTATEKEKEKEKQG